MLKENYQKRKSETKKKSIKKKKKGEQIEDDKATLNKDQIELLKFEETENENENDSETEFDHFDNL
jgi:hypothetical protein